MEAQLRGRAGSGASVPLSEAPPDTLASGGEGLVLTGRSEDRIATAVAAGAEVEAALALLLCAARSRAGDRDDLLVRRYVLSGVRENGNLTWAETDSCAGPTWRD